MFFVELKETEDVDEDEINKSIKEIHQSAQKLSDNIERLSNDHEKFVNNENMLSFSQLKKNDSLDDAIPDETGDSETVHFDCKVRSSTLKSNFTDDFDTPPETPEFDLRRYFSFNQTFNFRTVYEKKALEISSKWL